MRFNDDEINSVTHDLAQQCIAAHYPQEIACFPLVWKRFSESSKQIAPQKPLSFWRGLLKPLGLPYGDKEVAPLVSPLVILTIKAVLTEMGQAKNVLRLKHFDQAVVAAAGAFGASPLLARKVANYLAPELLALFENRKPQEVEKEREDPFISKPAPQGFVYADWLSNGEHKVGQKIKVEEILTSRVKQLESCTVLINESDGGIEASISSTSVDPTKRYPKKIGAETAAMLWLVLTHVGTDISLNDIDCLYGIEAIAPNNKIQDQRVYLYPSYLKKWLEGRWNENIMAPSGGRKKYYVSDSNWSFFWIRRNKNARLSELVQHYKQKGGLARVDLSHYQKLQEVYTK
ncbi:MAG: hypothetical protein ACXWJX_02335 [Limisphaerales bacterium]